MDTPPVPDPYTPPVLAPLEEKPPTAGQKFLRSPFTRLLAALLVSIIVGMALLIPLTLIMIAVLGGPERAIPSMDRLHRENVARLILFEGVAAIGALAGLLTVGLLLERRGAADLGFGPHGALRETLAGFLLGAAMISAVIGILALAGAYDVMGWGPSPVVPGAAFAGGHGSAAPFVQSGSLTGSDVSALLGQMLLFFLVVSVFEEVLFRGILFRLVEQGAGSLIALTLSGLLFGAVHLTNTGATPLAGLGVAVAGVQLGAAYMLTRNLWLAIGIHWAWNFVQGPIWGVPVSGTPSSALLHARLSGPPLLSGGEFGPEAGLPAILVSALVTAALLVLAYRRGRFIPAPWRQAARVLTEAPGSPL